MDSRTELIDAFLAKTVWRDWARDSIAGDASARRYLRLSNAGQSVIVMDAPPQNGEATQPFVDIAKLLKSGGLCPPGILAHDAANGLLVLSDLGETDFAMWLAAKPGDTNTLYHAAADILVALSHIEPPDHLHRMTPKVGAQMIQIIGDHYTHSDVTDLSGEMERALETHAPSADTFALRDFHAENLIWRPMHDGTDRVGLLDFQDAFVAPAGYDLASLLRDARRDVPDDLAQDLITYVAAKTSAGPHFATQVACLGVQRNLRILGVFARLSTDMGKRRYLAFMPRIWGHILADLKNPALQHLRQAVLDTVPPPTPTLLESLTP